jgi:hypothetical protein
MQGDLDHAALVVGYNKTEGYWLLRQAWGTGYGESVGRCTWIARQDHSQSCQGLTGTQTRPILATLCSELAATDVLASLVPLYLPP